MFSFALCLPCRGGLGREQNPAPENSTWRTPPPSTVDTERPKVMMARGAPLSDDNSSENALIEVDASRATKKGWSTISGACDKRVCESEAREDDASKRIRQRIPTLPGDVVSRIMRYAEVKDIRNAQQVSRSWDGKLLYNSLRVRHRRRATHRVRWTMKLV